MGDQTSYEYVEAGKSREFELKLPKYGCDDLYLHSKHYHDIGGLFKIIKKSMSPHYYDPNRHIISMTFDKTFKYPKSVYISNDLHELGWNIKCLSMGKGESQCSNVNAYPFWIERQWQEVIGWSMIGLFLLMACVGRTIEALKNRARRKHRERLKAQRNASSTNRTQDQAQYRTPYMPGSANLNRRRLSSQVRGNNIVEEEPLSSAAR